jgi:hypothetical protein
VVQTKKESPCGRNTTRGNVQSGTGQAYKYCSGGLPPLSLIHYTYCHCKCIHSPSAFRSIICRFRYVYPEFRRLLFLTMSTSYLQMTQSTSNASSSHGSGSSNATRNMPNTGMHMVPFPWSQPAHIPDPGYAPVHPYFPYGVPSNATATYGATPSYAPLAPSFGVGAGVPDHAFQAGLDGHLPPPVADVSGGNPLSQASGSSVGEKRAAEDLEDRDAKRTKTNFSKMSDDPLFVSFLLILWSRMLIFWDRNPC